MSHVDEGALHAYLDGALDEYPAAEARRVREHLEDCAECAERLEVERRVRGDASAMLGLAAPRVEAPSFEELRAYVRGLGAACALPGVRVFETPVMSARKAALYAPLKKNVGPPIDTPVTTSVVVPLSTTMVSSPATAVAIWPSQYSRT